MLRGRDWRFTKYLPTCAINNFPFCIRSKDEESVTAAFLVTADLQEPILLKKVQTKFKTSTLSIFLLKNNIKNLKRERIIHQSEISLKKSTTYQL